MKKKNRLFLFSSSYEFLFWQLQNVELKDIFKTTGCKKPCSYKKYSFIGDKFRVAFKSELFLFSLWSVSVDTYSEKEQLIYPLTSLVAEFGGTLGLFLGFSFMVVSDAVGNLSYLKNITI